MDCRMGVDQLKELASICSNSIMPVSNHVHRAPGAAKLLLASMELKLNYTRTIFNMLLFNINYGTFFVSV